MRRLAEFARGGLAGWTAAGTRCKVRAGSWENMRPVLAFTIGDHPFFRTHTRPRLWPSDHAGVAALLLF